MTTTMMPQMKKFKRRTAWNGPTRHIGKYKKTYWCVARTRNSHIHFEHIINSWHFFFNFYISRFVVSYTVFYSSSWSTVKRHCSLLSANNRPSNIDFCSDHLLLHFKYEWKKRKRREKERERGQRNRKKQKKTETKKRITNCLDLSVINLCSSDERSANAFR